MAQIWIQEFALHQVRPLVDSNRWWLSTAPGRSLPSPFNWGGWTLNQRLIQLTTLPYSYAIVGHCRWPDGFLCCSLANILLYAVDHATDQHSTHYSITRYLDLVTSKTMTSSRSHKHPCVLSYTFLPLTSGSKFSWETKEQIKMSESGVKNSSDVSGDEDSKQQSSSGCTCRYENFSTSIAVFFLYFLKIFDTDFYQPAKYLLAPYFQPPKFPVSKIAVSLHHNICSPTETSWNTFSSKMIRLRGDNSLLF